MLKRSSFALWTGLGTLATGIFAGVTALHLRPDEAPQPGESNTSVALGIFEVSDRLQLNVSFSVHFGTARDLSLTGILPDLHRPDHSVGWDLSGEGADHCTVTNVHLECAFGDTSTGDYLLLLVGDASCLCVPTEPTFMIESTNDNEPDDDHASQTLPGVGCMEGTYALPFHVQTKDFGVRVVVSTPSPFARGDGVELWVDLPPVPRDWRIEGPDFTDCMLVPDGDAWCGIGELFPLETWEVHFRPGPNHPCDRNTTATFVLSHDNLPEPQARTGELFGPACAHHEPGSEVGVTAQTLATEDGLASAIRLANNGSFFATNLELWAALPDPGYPWSLDEDAPETCQTIQRHWLTCNLESLGPFEELTVNLHAIGPICGPLPDGTAAMSTRLDRRTDNDQAAFDIIGVEDCQAGEAGAADVLVDHVAYHETDHAVMRINVTGAGPQAATNVRIGTNLPNLGGRWILFGEDQASCEFVAGNDLACDFGPLPAGAQRTIEMKAYTHSMDCAFSVDFLDVGWDQGSQRSEATIPPPPHKMD